MMGWVAGFCLLLTLVQPGAVVADDDGEWEDTEAIQSDDGDDDGAGQPVPAQSDDDGDDDGGGQAPVPVDDDSDDDGNGQPAPAPVDDDTNDDGDVDLDDDASNDPDDDSVDDDDDNDQADDGLDRARPDQAIVQLRGGVNADDFASRHNATVLRVIPEPNIVLLELNPELDDDAELDDLTGDDDVEWSELNFTSQAPEGRPRYFFTSNATEPQMVESPALPAGLEFTPGIACTTGASVTVAVLDTGVDTAHPDLSANVLPNGVNMVDNTYDVRDTGNGRDDDNDGQVDEMVGHGTHVSGIVLQVAPGAQILPVKVLNSDGVGDAYSVTSGIHYAVEQGADVINLSLGSTYDSLAIRNAVEFATSQGVVVVAAAGNSNQQVPAEYPAASDAVISVAATTSEGDKAAYSNYHETVDISAPGDNVASAYPGGLYTTASGTSMSAPLVAGGAALVLDRQPNATPASIATVIESTSSPLHLADPALDGLLGAGELDIDASISCKG
jgi:subtilisin family serine protease